MQEIIKLFAREANRNRLDYGQLRYIFREVRLQCRIAPEKRLKEMFDLPTGDELERFYRQCTPFHRLLFKTLEGTGLRVSELCNLELRDVDFQNNRIFVRQGKGGKDRYTYFGHRLKEHLLLYLSDKRHRYLFESTRCSKFSTRTVQHFCRVYKESARIDKRFTVHTLRHCWNTNLAENGVSTEHRAYLAGHSDLSSQEIYTHVTAGGIKDKLIGILDKF